MAASWFSEHAGKPGGGEPVIHDLLRFFILNPARRRTMDKSTAILS
jgi:hypothetical protein